MACKDFVDCYKNGSKDRTCNCPNCLEKDSAGLTWTCKENNIVYILRNYADCSARIRQYKTDIGNICQGIVGNRCDYLLVLSKRNGNSTEYRFVYVELKSGSTDDFNKALRQLQNTSRFLQPVVQTRGFARIVISKVPSAYNTPAYREVYKYFDTKNLICKSRMLEENVSVFFS